MKFVIITNAAPITKEEILSHSNDAKIIALDGIADHLLAIQVLPYAVVGDFDSISPATIEKLAQAGVIIFQSEDQNSTDLDKGIKFCRQNNATEIIIMNAFGGRRPDHTLINYRSLRRHSDSQCRIKILEQNSYLEYFYNINVILSGPKGMNVALLAAPHAQITSEGLQYDMQDYTLEFGYSESSSNALKADQATIEIKGEAFLIYEVEGNIRLKSFTGK